MKIWRNIKDLILSFNYSNNHIFIVSYPNSGRSWLKYMFDHTYLVAEDDPELETIKMLQEKNLIDMRLVPAVGCERFAEQVFDFAQDLVDDLTDGRCWVQEVTVREHEHNSATVERNDHQKIV